MKSVHIYRTSFTLLLSLQMVGPHIASSRNNLYILKVSFPIFLLLYKMYFHVSFLLNLSIFYIPSRIKVRPMEQFLSSGNKHPINNSFYTTPFLNNKTMRQPSWYHTLLAWNEATCFREWSISTVYFLLPLFHRELQFVQSNNGPEVMQRRRFFIGFSSQLAAEKLVKALKLKLYGITVSARLCLENLLIQTYTFCPVCFIVFGLLCYFQDRKIP